MEYGPWEGGRHAGCVYQSPSSPCSVRLLVGSINHTERIHDPDPAIALAKAKERRAEFSIRMGLTKNRFRLITDPTTRQEWYEMELTRGKTMFFDKEDLPVATQYTWNVASKKLYYAYGYVNGKDVPFHRVLTGWAMVDHINRDPLDNRRSNLRETTFNENSRNRRTGVNNKSGRIGVCESMQSYVASWNDATGRQRGKRFSWKKHGKENALQLAVAYRAAMEEKYYEYLQAPDTNAGMAHQNSGVQKKINKPFRCPQCDFQTAYKKIIACHVSRMH